MHSFKKAVLSTFTFVLFFAIISSFLMLIYFNTESNTYQDTKFRDKLAGKIDYICIGSSHGLCGFIPEIIDKEIGVTSYNLCGSAMSPNGKIALLEEEIYRNPVDTVFIDVCSDDITYNSKTSNSEGEIQLISRFKSRKKRTKYFFENVYLKDYGYPYGTYMNNGITTLKDIILGSYKPTEGFDKKGFASKTSSDLFLNNDKIVNNYQSQTIDLSSNENIQKLCDLIEICKQKGTRVVLVSLPITDRVNWQRSNNDELYSTFLSLAQETNCLFLDFNLLKDRNKLFSDEYSFFDDGHLSYDGARTFCEQFCCVINKINSSEDISDMFYPSYDEAIKHFEYYEIYQSLMKEQN